MNIAHAEAKDPSYLSDRLNRLEDLLASDPSNAALLVDAFDVAMAAGLYDNAERHFKFAIERGHDPAGWLYRFASLRIAQDSLTEAREIFNDLQAKFGSHPMIAYKLASMDFTQGDFASCIGNLDSWMNVDFSTGSSESLVSTLPPDSLGALQALWLRALHHNGELERAWSWLESRRARLDLASAAAGIACMIAIDVGRTEQVMDLARLANSDPACRQEVHLALGTVSLAAQDASGARKQLREALSLNNTNGRVWSTLGFTELHDQHAEEAVRNFERSVELIPKHAGTWIGLGWARMLALPGLDGARQAFQAALDLDHNFAESHGCMAVVMALEGLRQEAEHHIELADRLDRSNMAARYAQVVLDGKASDAATVRRLARRLLVSRAQPLQDGTLHTE